MGIIRVKRNKWWNKDNVNEHNVVKNPNWQETDQLAIYKPDRGVKLGTTENNTSWWSERDLKPPPPDFKFGSLTMHLAS